MIPSALAVQLGHHQLWMAGATVAMGSSQERAKGPAYELVDYIHIPEHARITVVYAML